MRDFDSQLNEIVKRSDRLKIKKEYTKHITSTSIGLALCVIVMIVVTSLLPKAPRITEAGTMSDYGSMIIMTPSVGYVVVAFLAFLLGILVTLLCKRIYDMKKLLK